MNATVTAGFIVLWLAVGAAKLAGMLPAYVTWQVLAVAPGMVIVACMLILAAMLCAGLAVLGLLLAAEMLIDGRSCQP